MTIKKLLTGHITYIELLEGSGTWYWGTDYANGDLYEAEECFQRGSGFETNRLVLISHPQGEVFEPLRATPGQYFGKPVFHQGLIYFLLVDFVQGIILIYKWKPDMDGAQVHVSLSLDTVPDTYNLMLEAHPLMLTRQGHENRFQIIWPDQADFEIDGRESFVFRQEDKLYFSKWLEGPDDSEEVVIRQFPTGEILERIPGTLMVVSDGLKWILE